MGKLGEESERKGKRGGGKRARIAREKWKETEHWYVNTNIDILIHVCDNGFT